MRTEPNKQQQTTATHDICTLLFKPNEMAENLLAVDRFVAVEPRKAKATQLPAFTCTNRNATLLFS